MFRYNTIKTILLSNTSTTRNIRLFASGDGNFKSSSPTSYTVDSNKFQDIVNSNVINDMKSFMKLRQEKGYEFNNEQWLEILKARGGKGLPTALGLNVLSVDDEGVEMEMKVTSNHVASNGYIHAGGIITLADTACGYGCFTKLPKNSVGFTTIELKSNFLATAAEGDLLKCKSKIIHQGKSTQVWDATVSHNDKNLAFFRCTEIVLYPQPSK